MHSTLGVRVRVGVGVWVGVFSCVSLFHTHLLQRISMHEIQCEDACDSSGW